MIFRELKYNEIIQVWNIDRTEHVDSIYILTDGNLIEKKINKTFYGWPPGEKERYHPLLEKSFKNNDFFFGGYEDNILKAVVILEIMWRGKNRDTFQLKFLHIDRKFRKQGIGKILFQKAIEKAKEFNAKRLYISSCENKNTVEFYKHMGCRITKELETDLYNLEPNDIPMEYIIK